VGLAHGTQGGPRWFAELSYTHRVKAAALFRSSLIRVGLVLVGIATLLHELLQWSSSNRIFAMGPEDPFTARVAGLGTCE
jgi:hypothetical protein